MRAPWGWLAPLCQLLVGSLILIGMVRVIGLMPTIAAAALFGTLYRMVQPGGRRG